MQKLIQKNYEVASARGFDTFYLQETLPDSENPQLLFRRYPL